MVLVGLHHAARLAMARPHRSRAKTGMHKPMHLTHL